MAVPRDRVSQSATSLTHTFGTDQDLHRKGGWGGVGVSSAKTDLSPGWSGGECGPPAGCWSDRSEGTVDWDNIAVGFQHEMVLV